MVSMINEAIIRMMASFNRERGQALAEYGLLVALIAVVAIAAITAVGTGVAGKLTEVAAELA